MPVSGFYLTQVKRLQDSLGNMGELAGKQVGEAVAAFLTKDTILAQEIINRDEELDRFEDDHEETIIQIIALNQPVARDLRQLIAYLRTNSSIERVGDLAVNIAKSAIRISDKPTMRPYVDVAQLYELVRALWEDAMRSFLTLDEALASELPERDDKVDDLNQEIITELIKIGTESPQHLYQATNIIGVSKNLERVADMAVDIGDEVVYARIGELRHHRVIQRQAATGSS